MKNFKLGMLLAMLVILGSCSEDKIDQSEEQKETIETNVGLIDGIYAYPPADEYSSKFNYFHNGVKLTDKKTIEKMLQNSIHFSYNELNIEIALNEEEMQVLETKNDLELSKQNLAEKAKPRRGRVYYNLWQKGKPNLYGVDNRTYPKNFHPTGIKFANLSNKSARVISVYFNTKTKKNTNLAHICKPKKRFHIKVGDPKIHKHHTHKVKYLVDSATR